MLERSKSSDGTFSPTRFTPRSEECFYAVVDSPEFAGNDAQLIYQALAEQLRPVSFGDFLKRYIYRKAEIREPFDAVSLDEYLDIILESFAGADVPASFRPSTARLRSVARNWLTRATASRESVLLIGFGLRMKRQDVDELLTKGLCEEQLNPCDLQEYLCAYCYDHNLGFHKYEYLMNACETPEEDLPAFFGCPASGGVNRDPEDELIRNARRLKGTPPSDTPERRQRMQFECLYRQAQEVTAAILNSAEQDGAGRQAEALRNELADSDQYYDYQKQNRIQRARESTRRWMPEDITPAGIEQVLQSAVPRDRHGNLLSAKKSAIYPQLRGRQLTRQRLEKLLSGETTVSRHDLITLQFYVYSQKKKDVGGRHAYYRGFVEQTNECLRQCGFGPLYTANPYECFLLMCILSEEPLSTYADVIELAYTEDRHEDNP